MHVSNTIEILEKAKKQRDNRVQLGYLSFYDNVNM